jgi:hypothetical protein
MRTTTSPSIRLPLPPYAEPGPDGTGYAASGTRAARVLRGQLRIRIGIAGCSSLARIHSGRRLIVILRRGERRPTRYAEACVLINS